MAAQLGISNWDTMHQGKPPDIESLNRGLTRIVRETLDAGVSVYFERSGKIYERKPDGSTRLADPILPECPYDPKSQSPKWPAQ
jgi:hypothetical protein